MLRATMFLALAVAVLVTSAEVVAQTSDAHRRSMGNLNPNPPRHSMGNLPPQQQRQPSRTTTIVVPNPHYPGWYYPPVPAYPVPVYPPYVRGHIYMPAPGYYYAPGYNPYYYRPGYIVPRYPYAF